MVKWVVQSNGVRETDNDQRLMDALLKNGIPYHPVGLIPFTDKIIGIDSPDEVLDLKGLSDSEIIFYGSTKLVEIAHKCFLNTFFEPGVFYNPATFNVNAWNRNRDDMLNSSSIVMTMKEFLLKQHLLVDAEYLFVRPYGDLKLFNGTVVNYKERVAWYDEISHGGETVPKNALIAVTPAVNIDTEWRFFIVDNKVVSGSQYKKNGRLSVSPDVPATTMRMAEIMAEGWLPAPVVVMDVALTEEGEYKVIEFNCFNASGFYANDVERIVTEVTRYVEGKE